jgi:hypothetical protein
MLAKIDLDALKAEYDVLGAFLNGPRLWTLDWIEVPGHLIISGYQAPKMPHLRKRSGTTGEAAYRAGAMTDAG